MGREGGRERIGKLPPVRESIRQCRSPPRQNPGYAYVRHESLRANPNTLQLALTLLLTLTLNLPCPTATFKPVFITHGKLFGNVHDGKYGEYPAAS